MKEEIDYILKMCKRIVKEERVLKHDVSTDIDSEWKLKLRGSEWYIDVVLDLVQENSGDIYIFRLHIGHNKMNSEVLQEFSDNYHINSYIGDCMDWFDFAGEKFGMDKIQICFDELLIEMI